jgi:phosphatidylinositol-3-phosphatase
MWDFFHRLDPRAHDGGTASAHDSQAAPRSGQTQVGPRLPSHRSTAAIAGIVLLASIGLGAALPGGRAAGARSPLSTSLLAALAAQRDQKGSAASNTPSSTNSSEPEDSGGKQEMSAQESSPASSGKSSSGKETSETSPETNEGGSSGASGKGEAGSGSPSKGAAAPVPASLLAQIQHVWVISLSGDSFATALASQSSAPYLTKQLIPQGTLLAHYSLVAASPAANNIALLSGQGPNPETEKGCPTYTALAPATLDSKDLAEGSGCVYPSSVHTLADQAAEAALTWRAYIQDMAPAASGSQSAATGSTCRHPALGSSEPASSLGPGNDYQLARNPFVFFDSLIESQACTKDDVDLTQLSADLASSANTPNLSWIVPAACDDGAAASCGESVQSGLAGADAFLTQVVPEITATADYKQHGLILISFDSAASASGKGAEQVGALLLSPFVNVGKRNEEAFNTYSLLRSLDRLFGVPLLGHAADQGVSELNTEVYRSATNTTLARTALARAVPGRGTAKAGG